MELITTWLTELTAPFAAQADISLSPLGVFLTLNFLVFLGGLSRGMTGFGLPLTVVTLASMIFPPQLIVPVVLVIAALSTLIELPRAAPHVDWRVLAWVAPASFFGLPFGLAVLVWASADLLRIIIGLGVLAAVIALLAGYQLKTRPSNIQLAATGWVSGLLHGIAGLSGPPLVITLLAMKTEKLVQRSTLVTFFFFIGVFGGGYYQLTLGFAWYEAAMGLLLIPIMMLGVECGLTIFKRSQSDFFRKATFFMLLALGASAVVRGFTGYLS